MNAEITSRRATKSSLFSTIRLIGAAGVAFTCLGLAGCGSGGTLTQAVPLTSESAKSGPITITAGGTYSGNWVSNDPSIPAVLITTDQPVVIQNSTVSGPGNLIVLNGKTMADLTVRNVTGTGMDARVAGQARGGFLRAYSFKSLVVQNCTITGTSFGVSAGYGTAQTVEITNNKGSGLEDRASDGKGGFLTTRPELGHFIQLSKLSAPNGAEIAWNALTQVIGQTSTEDPINIYLSQGGNGRPIDVHDNYMEGNSSPAKPTYSGNGIMTDGDSTGNTAWVLIQANEIVHTAGSGIAIATGHDITAQANRVVSCGKDAAGNTYTQYAAAAVTIWNYYGAPGFYNNSIATTTGGLVAVTQNGASTVNDIAAISVDSTDTIAGNDFTDPCMGTGGTLTLAAEDQERTYWANKLKANAVVLGDQH